MKLKVLLIYSLLFVGNTFAQRNSEQNYSPYYQEYLAENSPVKHEIIHPVSTIHYTVRNERKKQETKYTKHYNAEGSLLRYEKIIGPDDHQPILALEYAEDGLTIEKSTYYFKGKLKSSTTYKRDIAGHLISLITTNKKEVITNKNEWFYNADSCLMKSINYTKRGEKINLTWEYEYFSPCQKSKSKLYKGNGKLLKEWTFDCKEEGEILTKQKKTNQVCKWEEVDANFLSYVTQTFNEKGETVKNVTKVNKRDSSLVEIKSFNKDDKLVYHATYLNDRNKPMLTKSMKPNGKLYYENKYEYEHGKTVLHEMKYKDRLYFRSVYTYDKNNNLTELKQFDRKNRLSKTIQLVFI
jgi:hypothetical protein